MRALRSSKDSNGGLQHWLKWSLLVAFGLEFGYLAAFNLWLPARLRAYAKENGWELSLTGFRTFYPGDLRVQVMRLLGPAGSFELTSKSTRGRFKLLPAITGSIDLDWLRVTGVALHVAKPHTLWLTHLRAQRPARSTPREAALGRVRGAGKIHVDHATIECEAADFGALQLNGRMQLQATDAHLADGALRMRGFLRLIDVRAKRAGTPAAPLTALYGDAAWKITAGEGSGLRPSHPRLSLRSSLRWKAGSLHALLGAGPDLETRDAHLGVGWHVGEAAGPDSSSVVLQAAELRAPRLPGVKGGAIFRHARLRVELAPRASASESLAGELSFQSSAVEFDFLGRPQRFSIAGSATIESLNPKAHSLQLGSGKLDFRSSEPGTPSSQAQQPLSVELSLAQASWSAPTGIDLTGTVKVHGADASQLLDLGPPSPSARWMLSELQSAPFDLRLGLQWSRARVAFEDVVLTTARDEARGSLLLDDDGVRGAVLVERGALNVGIEIEPDTMKLDVGANGDWLARSVAELRSARPP